MLKKTKQCGGLAVSFNGNSYAVKNANVAVISNNCLITPVIVELFEKTGLEGIKRVTETWHIDNLAKEVSKEHLDKELFTRFEKLQIGQQMPQACWITRKNVETLTKRSSAYRKTVRGTAVGSLG